MRRIVQRKDRISIRLSPQSKGKLERAAAYADKTMTDFVLDSALRSADAVLREHEIITLSAAEWQRFRDLLVNPPEPTETLKQAFREHRRVITR